MCQRAQSLLVACRAQNVDVPRVGPEQHGRVPVPAFERHALVAGVAFVILLGLDRGERFGRNDLVAFDRNAAEAGPLARRPAPVLGRQAGLVNLAHFVLAFFLVALAAATPAARLLVGILGGG